MQRNVNNSIKIKQLSRNLRKSNSTKKSLAVATLLLDGSGMHGFFIQCFFPCTSWVGPACMDRNDHQPMSGTQCYLVMNDTHLIRVVNHLHDHFQVIECGVMFRPPLFIIIM